MKKNISFFCQLSLLLVFVLFFSACDSDGKKEPSKKLVTIGAGSVTGVYYPTAGAVAKILSDSEYGKFIRATVEATGGSEYNVNAMSLGDLDIGMVQSDVAYMAYHGEGNFKGRPFTKLRSLFSLHPEPFHIVARKDRGISAFADLKGKKVNIGNPGSGQRLSAEKLFSVAPFALADMQTEQLKASEAPDYMRDGRIDAYFYMVGTGSANIIDIANSVDVNIIGLDDDLLQKLLDGRPYYVTATIPAETYPGNNKPVTTFAVKATLMTTTDLPDDVAYRLVKSLFENFDKFKKTHPALAKLTPAGMLTGLSAPFHPGAEKYYKEKNLLPQ